MSIEQILKDIKQATGYTIQINRCNISYDNKYQVISIRGKEEIEVKITKCN